MNQWIEINKKILVPVKSIETIHKSDMYYDGTGATIRDSVILINKTGSAYEKVIIYPDTESRDREYDSIRQQILNGDTIIGISESYE
jgi:hypothetical protein